MNEPFGRQPQPVTVILIGHTTDVDYWITRLARAAEFKGDVTVYCPPNEFIIHPRAVND